MRQKRVNNTTTVSRQTTNEYYLSGMKILVFKTHINLHIYILSQSMIINGNKPCSFFPIL